MKIIGLTGGIASGKNFIAEVFKKIGAIIFDADAEVHEILRSDKVAISEIAGHFSVHSSSITIYSKATDAMMLDSVFAEFIIVHVLCFFKS